MLTNTQAACVATVSAPCLRKEKDRRRIKEWYKQRPQYIHENLATDLMLSEPSTFILFYFLRFDGPSFEWVFKTVTPKVAKEILTCGKQAFTVSVYPLRYVIWPLEIILKT